jgi:tetratricopeptide (TPR) repeat protein
VAHTWRGNHADALAAARASLELLEPGSAEWCIAAGDAAIAAGRLGDVVTVVATAEALSDLAPPYDVESRVIAAGRTVMQLFVLGRYDLAAELLESIEAEADAVRGHPIAVARLALARAFRAHFAGDSGAYLEELTIAATEFERAGDLRDACVQRGNIGHALIELGAFEEAVLALEEALAGAERMKLSHIASVAKHNLGLVLGLLGRFEDGVRYEREALREFEEHTDRRLSAASRVYLSQILALAGDLDAAEATIHGATGGGAGEPLQALALATRARIQLARGDAARAFASASEALAILDRLGGIDEGEPLVRLVYAEAALSLGRADARPVLDRARERLLDRAAKIRDEALRRKMLGVPDHARILALAAETG